MEDPSSTCPRSPVDPWCLVLVNPALVGSHQDFLNCQEALRVCRSLREEMGDPEEIVYSCDVYHGITPRNPDLVPMLREEGFNVIVILNPLPETIYRAGVVNYHPRFEDAVMLHVLGEGLDT
jgi:hypothetical protein